MSRKRSLKPNVTHDTFSSDRVAGVCPAVALTGNTHSEVRPGPRAVVTRGAALQQAECSDQRSERQLVREALYKQK